MEPLENEVDGEKITLNGKEYFRTTSNDLTAYHILEKIKDLRVPITLTDFNKIRRITYSHPKYVN